jgi:ATP-dependent DNA ligase
MLAFDVLFLDGEDLQRLPVIERGSEPTADG